MDNGQLRAVIKSFGAELKSLQDKATGQEYMWEADPKFWGKTSPVLFPFIGKLEGAGYRYQNTFYGIEKHGFARDMEFAVVSQGEASITLAIESDETTLKKFPFAFRLELSYALEGRSLTETWKVINNSGESMYVLRRTALFGVSGPCRTATPVISALSRGGASVTARAMPERCRRDRTPTWRQQDRAAEQRLRLLFIDAFRLDKGGALALQSST